MRPPVPPPKKGGLLTCAGAQQMAVVQKVGAQAGLTIALPRVDDAAFHVDQIGVFEVLRSEQGVAFAGRRLVDQQTELRLGRLSLLVRFGARNGGRNAEHYDAQRQQRNGQERRQAAYTESAPIHKIVPFVSTTWIVLYL